MEERRLPVRAEPWENREGHWVVVVRIAKEAGMGRELLPAS